MATNELLNYIKQDILRGILAEMPTLTASETDRSYDFQEVVRRFNSHQLIIVAWKLALSKFLNQRGMPNPDSSRQAQITQLAALQHIQVEGGLGEGFEKGQFYLPLLRAEALYRPASFGIRALYKALGVLNEDGTRNETVATQTYPLPLRPKGEKGAQVGGWFSEREQIKAIFATKFDLLHLMLTRERNDLDPSFYLRLNPFLVLSLIQEIPVEEIKKAIAAEPKSAQNLNRPRHDKMLED